ncbi:MAG: hypothetical protein K2J42_07560 [Muribaculaceae bacterium]|nr:hypothetical protein [Muribaculaceae bacterium]
METKVAQLPDIDLVNFNDQIEVESYVSMMVRMGSDLGAFIPGFRPTAEWKHIRKTAKSVVKKLETLFPTMSPAQKIMSEYAYDMAHRIGYSIPADTKVLNKHVLEAFEARIRGDKTVDEYTLYRGIDTRISKRIPAFLDKPLTWNCLCLDNWFENQCKPQSAYDQINQVTILLNSRLSTYVFGDQDKYKKELLYQNLHYFENLPTDIRELIALNQLLTAGFRYLTPKVAVGYKTIISNAIIAKTATNSFYREITSGR